MAAVAARPSHRDPTAEGSASEHHAAHGEEPATTAVQRGRGLAGPLASMAVTFELPQGLPSIHTAIGASLGDRIAAWLYDRATRVTRLERRR